LPPWTSHSSRGKPKSLRRGAPRATPLMPADSLPPLLPLWPMHWNTASPS
jgi:hypothetical protein